MDQNHRCQFQPPVFNIYTYIGRQVYIETDTDVHVCVYVHMYLFPCSVQLQSLGALIP